MRTAAACLALLAAPAAARVCDDASAKKVPCFKLAGGNSIPQIAMGTWGGSYGDCKSSDFQCVQQHARFAVDEWLHIGGTHVDSANDYRTQTMVAQSFLESRLPREEVFITTKCPGAMGYEATIQCADDNLQMLGQFTANGVAYIDLLLIHFPKLVVPKCRFNKLDPDCIYPKGYLPATKKDLQDTWRAMEDLKKMGVVKAIGVSDYNITNLQDTLEAATLPIELHQVEWNPKTHDEAMLSFCKQHGIQLQAWSPLGGAAGSVLGDPKVEAIAKAHNVSTAQVVLRWSLQRDVAVVVGTANADHARSDLDIFGFQLTADEVSAISALGAPVSVQV